MAETIPPHPTPLPPEYDPPPTWAVILMSGMLAIVIIGTLCAVISKI